MLSPLVALMLAAPPAPTPLVEVKALLPSLVVDFRYATTDNFMKKAVYPPDARCLLVEPAAQALVEAARLLAPQGFALKVYDCYRPRSVQWELWKVFPKPGYVADPRTGSHHNRGAAVDLTLVRSDGGEVEMPTPYDTFTKAAHQGYPGGTSSSRANRETLRRAMEAAGFEKNPMEWWHFQLPKSTAYPLRDDPFTAVDAGAPASAPAPRHP